MAARRCPACLDRASGRGHARLATNANVSWPPLTDRRHHVGSHLRRERQQLGADVHHRPPRPTRRYDERDVGRPKRSNPTLRQLAFGAHRLLEPPSAGSEDSDQTPPSPGRAAQPWRGRLSRSARPDLRGCVGGPAIGDARRADPGASPGSTSSISDPIPRPASGGNRSAAASATRTRPSRRPRLLDARAGAVDELHRPGCCSASSSTSGSTRAA